MERARKVKEAKRERASPSTPLKGLLLHVKSKQFYTKDKGIMRLVGSFSLIPHLKKEYDLLHIIDEDLAKGNTSNLSLYESLTYHIYVQVELPSIDQRLKVAEKLQLLNVRVVLTEGYEEALALNPNFLAFKLAKPKNLEELIAITDELINSQAGSTRRAESYGKSHAEKGKSRNEKASFAAKNIDVVVDNETIFKTLLSSTRNMSSFLNLRVFYIGRALPSAIRPFCFIAVQPNF